MNPMDPELMRMAQEQMSRMSPQEMARIQQQVMSNPELMKLATETMNNMRPEDLRVAAEQIKHSRPEEMAQIGERMANATPEELAAMHTQADRHLHYQLNAAQFLKEQGNKLHSSGKFHDAAQKYLLAKNNLKDFPDPKFRTLQLQCSLNLMSCYLKTKQFQECIDEGSQVLAYDPKNVKALYRRGQAYKETRNLEVAVHDLSKAHELSPQDETIADVLRDAKEKLNKEVPQSTSRGVIIEEVEEEESSMVPGNTSSSGLSSRNAADHSSKDSAPAHGSSSSSSGFPSNAEYLTNDPEAIRLFQSYVSNANPNDLAAMDAAGMPPDMVKKATDMISRMKPDELQKMLQIASSLKGQNVNIPGTASTGVNGSRLSSNFPEMTPEMINMATEKINKMPPDELQKIIEVASSLNLNGSTATPTSGTERSPTDPPSSVSTERSSIGSPFLGNSTVDPFPNSEMGSSLYPNTTTNLHENVRSSMRDPAMRQMFTSMLQNMNPEMIANMGEKFGVKLSKEDAARAQQAMSSLSPDTLERMIRWADRAQKGVETARKTKNWLLGRPGMILAICMLILAFIFHKLGYIGG